MCVKGIDLGSHGSPYLRCVVPAVASSIFLTRSRRILSAGSFVAEGVGSYFDAVDAVVVRVAHPDLAMRRLDCSGFAVYSSRR